MKYYYKFPLSLVKLCATIAYFFLNINVSNASHWDNTLGASKGFIENKGQFTVKTLEGKKIDVLFAYDGGSEDYYFTEQGVVLSYTQKEKRKKMILNLVKDKNQL